MELLAHDLHHMLEHRPGRVVSEEVAMMIWEQIIKGLQHVHFCGIVHRDMHSANVLIHHSAPSQTTLQAEQVHLVKLADFGKATTLKANAPDGAPVYTARTAALSAIAPEVLFCNGTVWAATHKRSAHSQLDQYVISHAPQVCSYSEKIDVWASGILLIYMAKGRPYEGRSAPEIAREMIELFGKVPRAVARKYGWSVPADWQVPPEGGLSAPSQSRCNPKLSFEIGSLLWQEKVDRALKVFAYDPAARP